MVEFVVHGFGWHVAVVHGLLRQHHDLCVEVELASMLLWYQTGTLGTVGVLVLGWKKQ